MKQRVALCRAQVHQPKVILMDEPLGALDAFTRYKLQDQLVQLQKRSTATIILVTHDIDEAIYLSDHIILLGDGCNIISQYSIEQSHPRNRNDSYLLTLRNNIMEKFALNHHQKMQLNQSFFEDILLLELSYFQEFQNKQRFHP